LVKLVVVKVEYGGEDGGGDGFLFGKEEKKLVVIGFGV